MTTRSKCQKKKKRPVLSGRGGTFREGVYSERGRGGSEQASMGTRCAFLKGRTGSAIRFVEGGERSKGEEGQRNAFPW